MGNLKRLQGAPEVLADTTPMEMPVGFNRPLTLQEQIARMVRNAVEMERGDDFGSWEDEDDFEEEDPNTLDLSRYELQELQEHENLSNYGIEPEPMPQETGDPPNPNEEEPS